MNGVVRQAALTHFDARLSGDDDDDDSWWETFTRALDDDRLSNRPIFLNAASSSA